MEILEAFDLTGTLRGAAELVGCDHKPVAHWVRARDEVGGGLPVSVRPRIDAIVEKIEEWVDRSRGKIRADVAHRRLVAMGYVGSERTTRRSRRRSGVGGSEHGRRTRPLVTEPAVGAAGPRRRAGGRPATDGVVLRVAGVKPVPCGDRALGPADARRW
jgi:hypothetical protein